MPGASMSQVLGWAGWLFFSICIFALGRKLWREKWMSFAKKLVSMVSRRDEGVGHYREIVFCVVVGAGMIIGARQMSHPAQVTLYGLRVQKVLSDDSLNVISPSTGPVRIDACPENHLEQYLPKAGYVFCRIVYTPRGCMDVDPATGNKFEWVVNKDGWTTTLSDQDTFQPWPDCHLDTPIAKNY